MRRLLLALLCLGCARATTNGDGGSEPAGGDAAGVNVDGRASDLAPAQGPDAALPTTEAGQPEDPGFIPPSQRDGGIPKTPPGSPPCAPDSNAGPGNACPYKAIVECTPPDVRPVQTCICLAPPLGGKWSCETARDAGGPRDQ